MCQINIDGLSPHSSLAIDKYIADNDIKILAIQETGKSTVPCDQFTNMLTSSCNNGRGVALVVSPNLDPQVITDLQSSETDAVAVLCSISKQSTLIISGYCRPEISSTRSLQNLVKYCDKCWNWCKKYKVKSMLVLGDFNARHPNWGDTVSNNRGLLLSKYAEEHDDISLHSPGRNTFLVPNGGSVIDLCLSYGQITTQLSDQWTEDCYSLFTGAPTRGHIPVFQNIVQISLAREEKRIVFDYDAANWEQWFLVMNGLLGSELESRNMDLEQNTVAPKQLFQFFLDTIADCNKMYIPQKTVCKHSKPFWSKQLSTLSQALQKAQTNFKYRSDPRNKEVLQHAKSAFQESLISEKNVVGSTISLKV